MMFPLQADLLLNLHHKSRATFQLYFNRLLKAMIMFLFFTQISVWCSSFKRLPIVTSFKWEQQFEQNQKLNHIHIHIHTSHILFICLFQLNSLIELLDIMHSCTKSKYQHFRSQGRKSALQFLECEFQNFGL